MRNVPLVLLTGLLALAVSGCGTSNEQIGKTVQTSMQKTLDTDPNYTNRHMTVTGVQVLHQGDNRYLGIATVMHRGISHNVSVEITVDGQSIAWQIAPGAFMFASP